jgi:hypothetical protein
VRDRVDHHQAELDERFLAEAELRGQNAIPTQRPGVEWHRATWVLVVVAVCCGLAFVGWVFWYVFAGSKR